MSNPELIDEGLRRAIAMATSAFTSSEGEQADEQIALHRSWVEEDPSHEVTAMVGLQNLVTILLIRIEKATGVPATDELRQIAAKYLPNG